jgi:hypothetical protein
VAENGVITPAQKAALEQATADVAALNITNLAATPAAIVGRPFKGRVGTDLQLRSPRGKRGILVQEVGDAIQVERAFSQLQLQRDYPKERTHSGSKVAGATLRPNLLGFENPAVQGGHVVHGAENLFPFMTWTEVDSFGYPHHKYVQMLNSNPLGLKVSRGYESGQRIHKGDMLLRPGRGWRYEKRSTLVNVGWEDAFIEYVLEPNPEVGVFAGPHRLRFLSGQLGFLTATPVLVDFWVELAVHRAQEYSVTAKLVVYGASGEPLVTKDYGFYVTGGFNWLRTDAKLQLRWRVDRIANLNIYDDAYQGTNQGANTLRLDGRRLRSIPIGFRETKER